MRGVELKLQHMFVTREATSADSGWEFEELPQLCQAHTLVCRSAVMWNKLSGRVGTVHVPYQRGAHRLLLPSFAEGLLRSSRCARFPGD